VDTIVFDLQTTGGSVTSGLRIADKIHDLHERGIETIALVRQPGAAPNTLLALPCDKLILFPAARLSPLDPKAFTPAVSADEKKPLLDAMGRYGERRPRLKLFFQSLADPVSDVYGVVFEGKEGQGAFYSAEDYRKLMAAPPEPVLRSERVVKAGTRPDLGAADAERLGVSWGTVSTVGEVAARLGVVDKDLQTGEPEPAVGAAVAEKADEKGKEAALTGDEAPRPAPKRTLGSGDTVVFIPLTGMVGEGMRYSLERRLREVERLRPALIVFEFDTYGGDLFVAFDLSKRLFLLRGSRTVAYVAAKAISAGALLAVACDEIVMHTGSTLGDCQIVSGQGEAVRREKFDTVLRAWFRAFCEGKFPIALAVKMVDEDIEVYECRTRDGRAEYLTGFEFENMPPEQHARYVSTRKLFGAKTLLTMTDTEAKAYGFSRATVNTREELLALYGLADRKAVVLSWTWSEKIVRWLDTFGPLLLTLGVLAIFIELQSPGLGIFGIIGFSLIALFFFGKYMAGLAEIGAILLFAVGVILLLVEVFITPGFGVLGILGVISMFAGAVLALQPFVVPKTPIEWSAFRWNILTIAASGVAALIGALLIGRYLHRAPYLGKIILAEPPPSTAPTAVTAAVSQPSAVAEEQRVHELVGRRGRTLSMLRPAGRADFDGEPMDVVAHGEFIRPGEPIVICGVQGSRIVVRRET
jgi:membrane-bound serine protease (ClpP class)